MLVLIYVTEINIVLNIAGHSRQPSSKCLKNSKQIQGKWVSVKGKGFAIAWVRDCRVIQCASNLTQNSLVFR